MADVSTTDTVEILSDKTAVLSSDDTANLCENGICTYTPPPQKPQDRYKFIRSIGFGGMKSVLLVRDADTNREVAMAMMPDFRERPQSDLQRFVREAKITASLEHPYIVPVHDIGTDRSGSPYFTMKYLRGLPLSTLIGRLGQKDPVTVTEYPPARLLRLFTRICQAIEFAHSVGVCHLDLKPGNINVGEFGDTYILDWGLASTVDANGNVIPDACTISNAGTPGYMSPEQISSEMGEKGIKSDIYSLGALLYTILTLKSPAEGLAKEEVLKNTLNGTFPLPSSVVPEDRQVPASLEAVICRAMAPQPADRYNSVKDLRMEIQAFSSGFATDAEHASTAKRITLFIYRNAVWIVLTLLLMALIFTIFLLWMN